MSNRVVFFVSSGGYEAAWQVTSMGITAAAMGDEVVYVVAFDALRSLAQGTFGKPLNEREAKELTRAEGLNAPAPQRLLDEARAMGARVLACDTTVKLCGLVPAQLEAQGAVDEVMGLPSLWRLTEGARVLHF